MLRVLSLLPCWWVRGLPEISRLPRVLLCLHALVWWILGLTATLSACKEKEAQAVLRTAR